MKSSAVRKDESSYSPGESGEPVMSDQLEVRVARIESDIEHIKTHTAGISVELRRTNDRIDVTNERIEDLRDSLTAKIEAGHKQTGDVRNDLVKRIDDVRGELVKRIDDVRNELVKRIDDVRNRIDDVHKELTGKFDSLKDLIHSTRVWALLLYITLAGGLLTLIARAFKWM